MRHITWKRLGIIASVIWLVVAPTIFHLTAKIATSIRPETDTSFASSNLGWRKGALNAATKIFVRLLSFPTGAVGLRWRLSRRCWRGSRRGVCPSSSEGQGAGQNRDGEQPQQKPRSKAPIATKIISRHPGPLSQ